MNNIGEVTKLDELKRVYYFSNYKVELENVIEFVARPSGTHRLKTADNKLHIIPNGWLHIEIEAKSGDWTL